MYRLFGTEKTFRDETAAIAAARDAGHSGYAVRGRKMAPDQFGIGAWEWTWREIPCTGYSITESERVRQSMRLHRARERGQA